MGIYYKKLNFQYMTLGAKYSRYNAIPEDDENTFRIQK